MNIKTLTLIGVGLIGSSLLLNIKKKWQQIHIYGVDANLDNLNYAKNIGIIDTALNKLNDESANADIIIIATPVGSILSIVEQLSLLLNNPNTIISDVGSTKQNIIEVFRQTLPKHFAYCVAAHPIAGSEHSGASAGKIDLFHERKLIICPHDMQNKNAVETISNLWQSTGATIHLMDAFEHDCIFAMVSHLPHLLSYTYMYQITQNNERHHLLNFAGSGFRDFTRIAGSNPDIWTDVCLSNSQQLCTKLQDFIKHITQLEQLIANKDKESLHDFFTQAQIQRKEWKE